MHTKPTGRCARLLHRGILGLVFTITAANWPTQFVHAQTEPQWQLWKIDADGGGLALFADTPGYSSGSPEWSPDGKLVACDTWPVEETWQVSQVAVIRADGTQRRLLGPGAMPSWSPDGTHLVCHTYGPSTIVVMNADGSGREAILHHWGSPRWSPRGNRIASIDDNANIALFDLATGKEQNIFPGPYSARQGFAISPDGLRFCFSGSDGGVALATLNERRMQATVRTLLIGGTCYHASWSPDGKRVVFSWHRSAQEEPSQLYLLDVDANDPPVWLPDQDKTRNNVNPDWSPDGETIVFVSQLPAQAEKDSP